MVVTFGPKEAEQTLRAALATGADRAIRVDATDDAARRRLVALALKTLVEHEKPDLVLMGKQAVDGDTNQVGPAPGRAPRLADGDLRRDHPRGSRARCSSAARSTAACSRCG